MAEKLRERYRVDTNGCWVWQGTKDVYGYGSLTDQSTNKCKAHRVSYEVHVQPIPDGLAVLHRCDNPPCINPDHLFVGTDADNAADKVSKGRQAVGEGNGQAKLNRMDIIEIRNLAAAGLSQTEIARRYDINQAGVSRIVHRKMWRCVE